MSNALEQVISSKLLPFSKIWCYQILKPLIFILNIDMVFTEHIYTQKHIYSHLRMNFQ